MWQQIGSKSNRETSFYQGEFRYGLAHGWGEKKSPSGTYRGQYEKDKRHGFGERALRFEMFPQNAFLLHISIIVVVSGEWVFPDGSVSVSFWHFDSVVNPAFMPLHMRRELEEAIHKAQVSAVAAGCQHHFEVGHDEVSEWCRLRQCRVTEAKRKCAVELALTTNKVRSARSAGGFALNCLVQYFAGDVGFSTLPLGTPFHEKKSLEDLKRIDRDKSDLDLNHLEKYLGEEEFEEAFGISAFAFRLLKPQDQKSLVGHVLDFCFAMHGHYVEALLN